MTATLDELEEAALLGGGAHLDVYADALQEAGDIRGEIIAIERKIESGEVDAPLRAERRALLQRWLGRLADQSAVDCKHGFLELALTWSNGPEVFDELAARGLDAWVARIEMRGTHARARDHFAAIAAARWPRLLTLSLDDAYDDDPWSCDRAEEAMRGMARLRKLDIVGMDELPAIDHLRQLRELSIRGTAPEMARLGAGPFPVTTLALGASTWKLELPAERWAALHTLELVGGVVPYHQAVADAPVYAALERLEVLPQLRVLRMSELTTEADLTRLQRAIDRMPELIRLGISRVRLPAYTLRHPTAALALPAPTPWPPYAPYRGLQFAIPRRLFARQVSVEAPQAIAGLERCYGSLPAASREAWAVLWQNLYDISSQQPARVPMRVLRALFADDVDWWQPLRDAVAGSSSDRDATVSPIL